MDDNACLACGGRDYADWERVVKTMSDLRRTRGMGRVIVGGAPGADSLAEKWARLAGLPVDVYKAEWNKYGRAAGPKRNTRMLKEGKPRYVVAFPGGRGTDDMIRQAEAAGIEIIKVKTSGTAPAKLSGTAEAGHSQSDRTEYRVEAMRCAEGWHGSTPSGEKEHG